VRMVSWPPYRARPTTMEFLLELAAADA